MSSRLDAALAGVAAKKRLRLADLALRPALLTRKLAEDRRHLTTLTSRLAPDLAAARLARSADRLATLSDRLTPDLILRHTTRARVALMALDRLHQTLGYRATLQRGFAIVRGDGKIVTTTADAAASMSLELEFYDGRLPLTRPPRKSPKEPPPEQGTLL